MKSWKTTLAGAIAALGTYLSSVNEPSWLHIVGQLMVGAGTFLIGMFARDNDKTSESVGAKS